MSSALGPSPTRLSCTPSVTSELDPQLLEDWRHAAKDPDVHVPRWLAEGAPAGISKMPELAGIFPPVETAPSYEIQPTIFTDKFENYSSVEEDADADGEVDKLASTDYIDVFYDLAKLVCAVKGRPIVSKLALIKKVQNGKVKLRLLPSVRGQRHDVGTGKDIASGCP